MRKSIRWRLQIWYALVLLAGIGAFAGILYSQVAGAQWREVDESLQAAAQFFDANLRRFLPRDLAGDAPLRDDPFPPPPPDMERRDFRPPPPGRESPFRPPDGSGPDPRRPPGPRPPNRERLLAELDLPRPIAPPGA